MSFSIGIGISNEKNPFKAGRQAALLAEANAKSDRSDLALILHSIDYEPLETLKGIRSVLTATPLIGCTAAGIIVSTGIQKSCVAVAVIGSDTLKYGLGACESITPGKEREAGYRLARHATDALGNHHRRLFLMFSDGLIRNSSELIRGVQETLGKSFPFMSGSASDNFSLTATYQYHNDRVLTNAAVAALLGGDIACGFGVRHGWKPLGKPHIATKTDGNIIKTIDGQQAATIYHDYFGADIEDLHKTKLARMTVLYPLGIFIPGEDEYLLRNALDITDEGFLLCQGDIPEGSEIRLMMGSKESCLAAAREAAEAAKQSLHGAPAKLAIVFDSIARHKLLGKDAAKEIEIIKDVLGWNVSILGFYTYGEGAPLSSLDYHGQTYFHNETIAIVTIGEVS